ncbi:hypothetical protein CSAL01_01689 [Colletotrichum salicis]|uniref:Uncharacterized protein n=1 Tax=Colletotrichum salicis TaxID=1209931 RepID=A0A135V599_9PEZI|nr:hypothetical protein CSAL01_01689 [Colletotrichum salicis]
MSHRQRDQRRTRGGRGQPQRPAAPIVPDVVAEQVQQVPSLTANDHQVGEPGPSQRGLAAAVLLGRSFTPAENRYLYHRLPMRQPPTARTVLGHFSELPALYRDLADETRSGLGLLEGRERERAERLIALADALARDYGELVVCLPVQRIEDITRRNRGENRISKFWERVLEEVEVRLSLIELLQDELLGCTLHLPTVAGIECIGRSLTYHNEQVMVITSTGRAGAVVGCGGYIRGFGFCA